MINNCSILKKDNANQIEAAFKFYKTKKHKANSEHAKIWKRKYSVSGSVDIKFVGVWDTVGALGLPFTIFGLIKDKDLFYDREIGSNIRCARHALSLDEQRDDFQPTIWDPKHGIDLEQVWFAGVHGDVGGGYPPDKQGECLADIPLMWLAEEAGKQGLVFASSIQKKTSPLAKQHNEYKGIFLLLGKRIREIPDPDKQKTWVHPSVKARYQTSYKSEPIENYVAKHGEWPPLWPSPD
jgi:uncharacterized protein (DUF2235 family)